MAMRLVLPVATALLVKGDFADEEIVLSVGDADNAETWKLWRRRLGAHLDDETAKMTRAMEYNMECRERMVDRDRERCGRWHLLAPGWSRLVVAGGQQPATM